VLFLLFLQPPPAGGEARGLQPRESGTGCVAHRLDQRLNTFEARLAGATPEARALVKAAVEASVEAGAWLAPNTTTTTNGPPR